MPRQALQREPKALAVEVTGRRGAAPVVLFPGAGCDPWVWAGTIDHLAPRHEVHAVGLAGFGRPPIAAPLLETGRAELAAYLDHLEQPVLIGHSLGAFFAYAGAVDRAARVRAVVAVDGVPAHGRLLSPEAGEDAIARDAHRQRDAIARASRADFEAWLSEALSSMSRTSGPWRRMAAACDQRTLAGAMQALATADLRSALARAAVPILLVLAGEPGDGLSAEAHFARCAAQLANVPDHRIVQIDGARHFVMLDAPAAFCAALDDFLARRPGRRTGGLDSPC